MLEDSVGGGEDLFDETQASDDAAEEGVDAVDVRHDQLLQNINQLDSRGAGRSIVQRSEAAQEASEFHMATADGAGISVNDLLTSLGDKARHASLRKQVNQANHQKKLPPPLEKPQAIKVQRKAGYEKVTKEVTRWENVVKQRRRAEHTSFPLEKPDLRVDTGAERAAGFLPRTPLEQEIAALLGNSTSVVPAGEVLSERERRALAAMSLDEALERRRQLAKHRALLTYQEAKQRRHNKIKSRKYRRVLKKERVKQHLQDFERLKICDPEAALAKLQELERERVEERMSQRHKNTGKWARLQAIKRKYDPAAREALAENLRIGRDKTQKLAEQAQQDASSDDEPDDAPDDAPASAAPATPAGEADNPWMSADQPDPASAAAVAAYSGEYTRFWSGQEAAKRRLRAAERTEQAAEAGQVAAEREEDERPAAVVTAADVAGLSDEEGDAQAAAQSESERVAQKPTAVKVKKSLKRKSDAKGAQAAKKKKKLKTGTAAAAKKAKDIDAIFDAFERTLAKKTAKKLKQLADDADVETSPKKSATKKKKLDREKPNKRKRESGSDDESAPQPDNVAENLDESGSRKATLPELESLGDGAKSEPDVTAAQLAARSAVASEPQLDPTRVMAVEPRRLRSVVPEADGGGDEATENGDAARMTIAEAFADDDIVAEFREEKEATINADKPKDVDMTLPGWGAWGGQGLKVSAKKKRRLLFKAPEGPQRKDHHLGHVILTERRNEALRAHQPSELPYYMGSVASFEASIRAPVGRTWLPAAAHERATRPAVSTRAGTVIKPMDESALLSQKAKKKRRRPV